MFSLFLTEVCVVVCLDADSSTEEVWTRFLLPNLPVRARLKVFRHVLLMYSLVFQFILKNGCATWRAWKEFRLPHGEFNRDAFLAEFGDASVPVREPIAILLAIFG
jgi:hypothetical protein